MRHFIDSIEFSRTARLQCTIISEIQIRRLSNRKWFCLRFCDRRTRYYQWMHAHLRRRSVEWHQLTLFVVVRCCLIPEVDIAIDHKTEGNHISGCGRGFRYIQRIMFFQDGRFCCIKFWCLWRVHFFHNRARSLALPQIVVFTHSSCASQVNRQTDERTEKWSQ